MSAVPCKVYIKVGTHWRRAFPPRGKLFTSLKAAREFCWRYWLMSRDMTCRDWKIISATAPAKGPNA